MPTLEQNKDIWDASYDWSRGGDEWSDVWGNAEAQWYRTLWPRIHRYLPTGTILEIAPGFGRWTQYLKDVGDHVVAVDLAAKCIEACRLRFAASTNLEYHVTDGTSLAMVADDCIDFAFSFDSLVHASGEVLEAYLAQLGTKLTRNGVGFIHHSNCAAYTQELAAGTMTNDSLRDETMSAALFVEMAGRAGLSVIGQELLTWGADRKLYSDTISTFTRQGSPWDRPNRIVHNADFMQEGRSSRTVVELYHQ